MLKFICREIKDGACNQYSYEGELELGLIAKDSAELRTELERQFGTIVNTRKITGGHWRGALCVTVESGRWFRLGRAV